MKIFLPIRSALILKVLIFLLFLGFAGLTLFAFLHSYQDFLQFLIQKFHLYEREQLLSETISENKYFLIRVLLLAVSLLLFIFLLFSVRIFRAIQPFLTELSHSWKGLTGEASLLWKGLSRTAKITTLLLFSILIAYRLFTAFYYPFFTDEVYSYLFLVHRGPPVIVSNFHGPNSHTLYLLVAWVFDIYLSPQAAMRLPSFLAGILLPALIFLALLKRSGFLIALFTTVIFSFAFHINYYSVLGRGHIFFLLFFFIALISAVRISEGAGRPAFFTFGVANVLAGYTILSWVFPLSSLLIFLLVALTRQPRQLRRLVITLFLAFAFLTLLYLPVLLISGLESITGNWWVESFTYPPQQFFQKFPSYLATVAEYLWENGNKGMACMYSTLTFLVGAVILYRKGHYRQFWLLIAFLLMPFLLLPLKGFMPPEKTWLYFILLKSFCLAVILHEVINILRSRPLRQLMAGAVLMVSLYFAGRKIYLHDLGFYHNLQDFLTQIAKYDPETVLAVEETYYLYLRYQFFVERDKYVKLDMKPEPEMQYDLIVVPDNHPVKENKYELFYKNEEVRAYLHKPVPVR